VRRGQFVLSICANARKEREAIRCFVGYSKAVYGDPFVSSIRGNARQERIAMSVRSVHWGVLRSFVGRGTAWFRSVGLGETGPVSVRQG